MKLIKLTALLSSLLLLMLAFTGCEKDAEKAKVRLYSKTGIVMSYAQEKPAGPVPSTATGSLNVSYSKDSKTLTYKFSWSGLTGPVTVFHIHGLAPVGFAAPVVQTFTLSGIIPCTPGGPTTCGSYSGTLLADGVAIKEQDILDGFYYVNIHTSSNPGGEIKGQITFQ
jgi:CHRD domain